MRSDVGRRGMSGGVPYCCLAKKCLEMSDTTGLDSGMTATG